MPEYYDQQSEPLVGNPPHRAVCPHCCGESGRFQAVLDSDAAIEALAALSHDQWAGWTQWMFDKWGLHHQSGESFRERWQRQMATAYSDLTEVEKESDRVEARRMLGVIRNLCQAGMSDLEVISVAWERQTGYDSIATIRRVYPQAPSGAYQCVWPHCKVVRKDAAKLWKHVHTGHGTLSLPPGASG